MAACVVVGEIDWALWAIYIAVGFLVAVAFAMIAAEMALSRGRDPLLGAVLGVLLGPFAWLTIWAIGHDRRNR